MNTQNQTTQELSDAQLEAISGGTLRSDDGGERDVGEPELSTSEEGNDGGELDFGYWGWRRHRRIRRW